MKYLMIGGTGTLGTALVERLYGEDNEITVFSRGELAQKQMAQRFPKIRYIIGDIRDANAIAKAVNGIEAVFLLAAIKHVDVAESNPLEAIKTNVLGPVNVAEAAIAAGVKYVVFSNTDKSVLPITTYGYTKGLAQNYLLAQNGLSKTRFSVFNWGNIIASRGSVIPLFVKLIVEGKSVPITHPQMSRFWLSIGTAADFMLAKFKKAPLTYCLIPPVKAATVNRVIESISRLLDHKPYSVHTTGLRGIEKIHEVLESSHEFCLRSDTCDQYSDEELDALMRDMVFDLVGRQDLEAKEIAYG